MNILQEISEIGLIYSISSISKPFNNLTQIELLPAALLKLTKEFCYVYNRCTK